MKFNEYMPKGGWIKHRRRRATIEHLKIAGMLIALMAAYCITGYIERGM